MNYTKTKTRSIILNNEEPESSNAKGEPLKKKGGTS